MRSRSRTRRARTARSSFISAASPTAASPRMCMSACRCATSCASKGRSANSDFATMRQRPQRPAILLAGGTGIAPIKAMLEASEQGGMQRELHLYWGSRRRDGLYALDDFAAKACVRFTPVLSEPSAEDAWTGRAGFVHRAVMRGFSGSVALRRLCLRQSRSDRCSVSRFHAARRAARRIGFLPTLSTMRGQSRLRPASRANAGPPGDVSCRQFPISSSTPSNPAPGCA